MLSINVNAACSHGYFGTGDGTISNPYLVQNQSAFIHIKEHPDSSFLQTNDITFTQANTISTFGGTYNGNGYTIYNPYEVLFSNLNQTSEIRNLTIDGTSNTTQAVLAYQNYGFIEKVINKSNVLNHPGVHNYAIGIVFYNRNSGIIEDCENYGTLRANTATAGFAYENRGTIYRCKNYGELQGGWAGNAGISISNYGTISESVNYGRLNPTIDHSLDQGSLVVNNYSSGKIQNCYNTGAQVRFNLGFVGDHGETIRNERWGGIVFRNDGLIENVYTIGSIQEEIPNKAPVAYSNSGTLKNVYFIDLPNQTFINTQGELISSERLASTEILNILNANSNPLIWAKGPIGYNYPVLIGDVFVQAEPEYAYIGDNTAIRILLSGNLQSVNSFKVLNSKGQVVLNNLPGSSPLITGYVDFLEEEVFTIVAAVNGRDVASSNPVSISKTNVLTKILETVGLTSTSKVMFVVDNNRFYELNEKNRNLVSQIKTSKADGGIYFMGHLLESSKELFKPLLED